MGNNRIFVDATASTNNYALDLLKNSHPPEGTIVWTKNQTHGRGQRNNQWFSEPGKNLTFSVIFYPDFLPVEQQFWLTIAISLGVSDWLQSELDKFGKEQLKIKWPNDVYFGNKKMGGMLIENNVRRSQLYETVCGIGINVNQTDFDSGLKNTSSLKLITKKEYSLEQLLDKLCKSLEARHLQLKAQNRSLLKSDYLNQLYLFEKKSMFIIKGKKLNAKIIGITDIGKLVLENASADIFECGMNDVVFLHN